MMKAFRSVAVLIVVALVALTSCVSDEEAAAKAEAERLQALATLETAQGERREREELMLLLRTQAEGTAQIMAQAQSAAAEAQRAAAEAAKLQAIAITAAGQGIRIPSAVGGLALISFTIIVLVLLLRRPATAQQPLTRPKGNVYLLPNPSDPVFCALLTRVGGYWDNGRAIDARGLPVAALLEMDDE
jgi:hypothetical protein